MPAADATETAFGLVSGPDGARAITFARHYAAAPESVWAALTDSAGLAAWLAPATIEPRVGGKVAIRFPNEGGEVDGEVLTWEPYSVLEYTWTFPGSTETTVRFELVARDGGTELRLTHSGFAAGATMYAAGWHAHLDRFAAALGEGDPVEWDVRFAEVRPHYAGQ